MRLLADTKDLLERFPQELGEVPSDWLLIFGRSRFHTPFRIYDEWNGPLWILRNSSGIQGIVRADTWEDAWEISEDEFFPEADSWETIQRDIGKTGDELLNDGCFQEAYGFRPSGPRVGDVHNHGIYEKDLNGEVLELLTRRMITEWDIRLTFEVHREPT